MNYHYSKIYGGKMILRFDDTNPTNEKDLYVEVKTYFNKNSKYLFW